MEYKTVNHSNVCKTTIQKKGLYCIGDNDNREFNKKQNRLISIIQKSRKCEIAQLLRTKKKSLVDLQPNAKKTRESDKETDLIEQKQLKECLVFFDGEEMWVNSDNPVKLNGTYIFVLSPDDNLYVRSELINGKGRKDNFNHSNFLRGIAVKTAGEMFFIDGKLVYFNNSSGHYLPDKITLEYILDYLLKFSYPLDSILMGLINEKEEKMYRASYYDSIVSSAPDGKAVDYTDADEVLEKHKDPYNFDEAFISKFHEEQANFDAGLQKDKIIYRCDCNPNLSFYNSPIFSLINKILSVEEKCELVLRFNKKDAAVNPQIYGTSMLDNIRLIYTLENINQRTFKLFHEISMTVLKKKTKVSSLLNISTSDVGLQ